MDIVVRRSGGVTGMTRTWRADTAAVDGAEDWESVVESLQQAAPETPSPAIRDDFSWTIQIESTSVTVPGSQLREPWTTLIKKVCDEGERR